MNSLPVQRADQLSSAPAQIAWLIEQLWSDQAVGILGGEPKCCKSFLALDIALSVASGADCLRRFAVVRRGPVLLFPAEDSLGMVRQRLEGLAAAAQITLSGLPLHVITANCLRLDQAADRQRLSQTLQQLQPILLILDPLIRLHRLDENDATQIAALLSFLRQLQRQFGVAVLLVHHARKDSHCSRPGQALRGSSELHGWGDSNLYLRRQRDQQLSLSVEHRAAPSIDPMALVLKQDGPALALSLLPSQPQADGPPQRLSPQQRLLQALAGTAQPIALQPLRQRCGLRTATLCQLLKTLCAQGVVRRDSQGYSLIERSAAVGPPASSDAAANGSAEPLSQSSFPIDPQGNGNGKPEP